VPHTAHAISDILLYVFQTFVQMTHATCLTVLSNDKVYKPFCRVNLLVIRALQNIVTKMRYHRHNSVSTFLLYYGKNKKVEEIWISGMDEGLPRAHINDVHCRNCSYERGRQYYAELWGLRM
jgi:hypothetical protein